MFQDIKTSRDIMVEFRSRMLEKQAGPSSSTATMALAGSSSGDAATVSAASSGSIELQVQVLTTGSWPTQAACSCQLPREIERCCEDFNVFYLGKHTGRKLVWQTNMGTADIKVEFGSKRHELNVSTYQMCILMLFNNTDSMCYKVIGPC